MPTQKRSVSEKHSLDLISNMEPENVPPRGMYSRCEKSANNQNGTSLVEEMCSAQNSEFDKPEESPRMTTSQWVTVLILCFVNLINYMDRYTIAGKFDYVFLFQFPIRLPKEKLSRGLKFRMNNAT